MSWQERRYSVWLLGHEESLHKRQEGAARLVVIVGLAIGLAEGLLPWETLTPPVPAWAHIAAAAIVLPLVYFGFQNDFRRKLQAFTLAMSDRGLRLLFLDPFLEAEEHELQEHVQGAHLLPLLRVVDTALKSGASHSLHQRLNFYFRAMPASTCEGDRLGLLSILHPVTAAAWGLALALNFLLLPGVGLKLFGCSGFSALPTVALLYLLAARANTRFAFETALYNWLRLG